MQFNNCQPVKSFFSSVGKNLYNNMDTVLAGRPKGSLPFPACCDNERPIGDIKSFNERLVNCYGIRDGIIMRRFSRQPRSHLSR